VAPAGQYASLFERYVLRSVEAVYERICTAQGELTAEEREQAWHVLDYGLKTADAWPAARALLLALAPQMERAGFRHEWLPYLEAGVACSRTERDGAAEAQLSLHIGRLHRLRGELDEARRWFQAGAAHYRALGDKRGLAIVLNQLAYVARLQSRYEEAQTDVERALTLLEEGDSERATSYFVLGHVKQDQRAWTEAELHHRAAYVIWQATGNPQRAAWSLLSLGNTLRSVERYAEAATVLDEAIILLDQEHDPVNQAYARMNLGIVYSLQGKSDEALALYALAEPVFRQVQDTLHLAMVNNNIAIEARAMGRWQAAEQASLLGVRYWETLGDAKSLANTLDELGLAYLGQERWQEASSTFERALALLSRVPSGPAHDRLHELLTAHLAETRQRGRLPEQAPPTC
jgi:tetratricopeptide (TPR) repeat protein